MSDRLKISRRDFLNGIALGVAAGGTLSPLEAMARSLGGAGDSFYPPALTGMRGNHPGSFEVAHALSRGGAKWPLPERQTDRTYDLVVVGAGISGLSAAYFYRQHAGRDARILILDNHDDFGGHAKRNEFEVDGRKLIGYGGSQSMEAPANYSPQSKKLLEDIAVHTGRFYDYFDQDFFRRKGLGQGIWFSREAYGQDLLLPSVVRGYYGNVGGDIPAIVAGYPLPRSARKALVELMTEPRDRLPGMTRDAKIELLRTTSYSDFLRRHAGMPPEVPALLRDGVKGLWGVGWDALSALEAYRTGMPGTEEFGIGELAGEAPGHEEPYIFHFPDGNAGIARALVRQLIPEAVPGRGMEDLVTTRVDYASLDRASSRVRIRLGSTAVDVRHADGGRSVDVSYMRDGEVCRVRAKHAVLACYNNVVPHICSEVPEAQKEAIAYASKVPLVYLSIAVRNWRAFERVGFHSVYVPRAELMHAFGLDFPVSMSDYRYASEPEQPTVIHGSYVPTRPDEGLSAREQHLAGRRKLLEMTFDDFERGIVRQLDGALAAGGFDAERDIAAITVNRWPHGYAYEYNDYSDPPQWGRAEGPHVSGRSQIGRISIANSDSAAYAYVDGAIDAAHRAVSEQLAMAGRTLSDTPNSRL
jgi:spermidine dehydrogenase